MGPWSRFFSFFLVFFFFVSNKLFGTDCHEIIFFFPRLNSELNDGWAWWLSLNNLVTWIEERVEPECGLKAAAYKSETSKIQIPSWSKFDGAVTLSLRCPQVKLTCYSLFHRPLLYSFCCCCFFLFFCFSPFWWRYY